MKVPLLKNIGVDVDVTIRSRQAQLLIAAGVMALLFGIAWSFIQGWSTIKFNKMSADKHKAEEVQANYDK